MVSYLQINSLTKSVGDRILFSDITFGINQGDKIGLIAKNGTGKTTLLRCLAGEISADSGEIVYRSDLRTAFLPQKPVFETGRTVLETLLSADTAEARAVEAYEKASALQDAALIEAASAQMDAANAWSYEDRLRQLLGQLKLHDTEQKVETLSGGQAKRLAIARILLDEPEFLILDEPTNHLDIETIEWLENVLTRSRATILMVTHDRYFLDRVCNKTMELDRQQIFVYDGNYNLYLRRRKERIEAMTAELSKVKNTLRKEQDWMSRQPQARAGKAKFRIDQFYDLKKKSQINLEEKNISLDIKSSRIGSKIFEADSISKRFGNKVILDDFNYVFSRFEKVGIIGENGVGKTTFIKMLQGLIAPDSGKWDVGETVKFGYYSQDGLSLNPEKKVVDAITDLAEDIVYNGGQHIAPMQFLQRFLFSPVDQQKQISTLSGGEKARLHLAAVLMQSPNFLILDEPTNDLDIITLGILEEYLAAFEGCVIVVSHDRFFLDTIVDHLFVFQGSGVVKDFPGTYTEYREFVEEQKRISAVENARIAAEKQKESSKKTENRRAPKLSFKEQKELEKLTEEIEVLNREKNELETLFNSGETITDVAEKSKRYDEIKALLDEKEMRWLELSDI